MAAGLVLALREGHPALVFLVRRFTSSAVAGLPLVGSRARRAWHTVCTRPWGLAVRLLGCGPRLTVRGPRSELRVLGLPLPVASPAERRGRGGLMAALSAQAAARGSPTTAGLLARPPGTVLLGRHYRSPPARRPGGSRPRRRPGRPRPFYGSGKLFVCAVCRPGTHALRMSPHSG